MKAIKLLTSFSAILIFGCQTTVIPPEEFPTIDATKELHIIVRVGESDTDFSRFQRSLTNAFTELEYPGQIIVHKWSGGSDEKESQVQLVVTDWYVDDSFVYWCSFLPSLLNDGMKTPMGKVYGNYRDSSLAGYDVQVKGLDLAAQDAVEVFYKQFLPYTNLEN